MKSLFPLFVVITFGMISPAWGENTGRLETPIDGSVMSGIGIFSGWYCDAEKIEIVVDERPPKEAAYGTRRSDTKKVCGDSDNGFGLLWSYRLFGPGEHTVVALADGVEFDRATFTVMVVGEDFLKKEMVPESAELILTDLNQVVRIEWQESVQNFGITEVADLGIPMEQIFAFTAGKWEGAWFHTGGDSIGKEGGSVKFDLRVMKDKDGKARLVPVATTLTGTGCEERSVDAAPLDVNGISTRVRMLDKVSVVEFYMKATEALTAMGGTFVFDAGPCEGKEGVFTLFKMTK